MELRKFFSCTGWQTPGPAFLMAPWVGAYWHVSCLTKWSELFADEDLLTWIRDDGLDPSKAVETAWGHGCKSKNKKAKRITWNKGSWANPEHPVGSTLPKSIMTMTQLIPVLGLSIPVDLSWLSLPASARKGIFQSFCSGMILWCLHNLACEIQPRLNHQLI